MSGLVRREGNDGELAPAPAPAESHTLTGEQVELIKRTICRGASDDELALFVQTSKRLGLDPFARQIFAVMRNTKVDNQWVSVMSIQTSIDGYRLIADRTGKYEGQLGPFWCGDDGAWVDVWLAAEAPRAARVGVLKSGFREPLWSVALWHSYAQKKSGGGLNRMWSTMGPLMIGKCAEALALRRAFPAELSGVYTTDEMGQADNDRERPPKPSPPSSSPPLRASHTRRELPIGNDTPPPEAEPLPSHTSQRVEIAKLLVELKRKRTIAGVDTWVTDNPALQALEGAERKQVIDAYRAKRGELNRALQAADAAAAANTTERSAAALGDDAAERAGIEADDGEAAESFFNDQANTPDPTDPMEGF